MLSVFVACPYSPEPIQGYREVFRSVQSALPFVQFQFADEKINSDVILDRITRHIKDCSVCMCDITGWNPNVTLEFGLAMGMSKRVQLLFRQKWSLFGGGLDLPVDIRGHARINYKDADSLRAQLTAFVKQEAEGPNASNATGAFSLLCESTYGLLGREPNLKSWEIAKRLGMETPAIKPALDSLVHDGRVIREGKHQNAVYHQKGYKPPASPQDEPDRPAKLPPKRDDVSTV